MRDSHGTADGPDSLDSNGNDEAKNQPLSAFQLYHLAKYAEIGMALSGEEDVNRLLEMIIHEAREITDADAGTLYMVNEEGAHLDFVVLQNDTMNTRMGGTSGVEINLPPVPLYIDGKPNHGNVSSWVAITGELVNIADVYESEDFDFTGPRKYDQATGYRSKSMLVIPMRNHENDVIGVMQLLNAQDVTLGGEISEFSDDKVALVVSLASQAAAALTKTKLIQDLKDLFYSFIKSIANAIEEKSPYTGGHINRVVDITMMIAGKINEMDEGPFAHTHFSDDDLEELKLAAWLHDVGKIITPEYVVDKSSKLETIFDRIEMVKARFNLQFKILEADFLARRVALLEQGCEEKDLDALDEEMRVALDTVREDRDFVVSCNEPGEFMSDERIERLKGIGAKTFEVDGETQTYLTDNEIENLCIRKGTLTFEERKIIENHATMTGKILGELPFPKKLSRVPEYARGHHEKIDGTGYPLGLGGDDLPIQARIMAVADIFEALTAKDRPYKKPMPLSQAVKILGFMKKDNHIDSDVHDLFLSSGLFADYAGKELNPWQIDEVPVNPCLTGLKVLVAMSGQEAAEAVCGMFSAWNADLDVAEDGQAALDMIQSAVTEGNPYRIAVLDRDLSVLGGLDVAVGFKAKASSNSPAFMIIAGDGPELDLGPQVAGFIPAKADAEAVKPLVFEILSQHPGLRTAAPDDDFCKPAEEAETHRILLVADSANTRMLIKYYLKETPYQVEYAHNGREALEKFSASRYSLVVMDMQLPVMNGFDATAAMRKWEEEHGQSQVAIIALTSHYVAEETSRSLESGCNAYLTKPVSKSKLLGMVEKHASRAQC